MSQLSKQALKVENQTSFPNNNTNYITPAILRDYNVDIIDSMVDEIPFGAYTQSVDTSIDALNAFTASATGLTTGSLLITASAAGNVITFTKGNGTTFGVTVATGSIPDVTNLNQATASLQAYTASANVKFQNLESTTASLNTSVTNINTFTASTAVSITNINSVTASQQTSINNLNAATGSYATTGSNTFTSANTFTSISASSFVSASQFVGDGSKITNITASIALPILDEGVPVGNAVSMNFTGSGIGAIVVGGVAIVSVNTLDTGSFNSFTASTNSDLASIHQTTASLNTATASLNTSASLALVTASFDNGTRNLTFTKGDTTTFSVNIPDVSGSTGNFATTGSNVFVGDQTISGSLFQSGSLLQNGTTELTGAVNISGSTTIKGQTRFYDSSTTITGSLLITGSTTQIGNNLLIGTTTLSGSVFVSGNIEVTNGANLITHNVKAAGSNGLDILANNGATIATMGQGGGTQANFVGSLSANSISASTITGLGSPSTFSSSVAGQFAGIASQSGSWITESETGSFATTGANVFTGNQTIFKAEGKLLFQSGSSNTAEVGMTTNGNLQLAVQSTQIALLDQNNVTLQKPTTINGTTTINGDVWAVGANRNFTAAANTAYSGSQYPGFTAIVSAAETPTDVFGGFSVNNSAGTTLTSLVVNSYTPQYGGTPTPVLLANGNNPGGNDTAIGFPSNGQADHWKKSNFKYGIEVTGSTNIQSLTASLANGYVWVGDSTGKTTTVATSSFAGGVPVGTATTGSNTFIGDQTISGSLYVSGAVTLFADGANGFTFSGKSLYLTNSVQTGITHESPISFYQNQKGNMYIQNNVAGIGSGSINIIAANNSNLNVSASNLALTGRQSITAAGGNGLEIYGSGLNSQGTIVGQNNIQALGQNANMYIMANSNFSGSQYPGQTIIVAPNVYPTDIYGGLSIVTELGYVGGATFLGIVANSYSPQYSGTTVPMIIANGNNPAGNDTALIWTSDGNAEHWKKSLFKYGADVTGSLVTSGSFVLTGSAAGNVVSASITSNTASIDFSKGNYFEVTSSVTPLHLNVTNITPGRTSTLIVSASASSSITFSPNVAQPSGNAYSGSAGSIDILSLVAFNSSKVNVVSTKALV